MTFVADGNGTITPCRSAKDVIQWFESQEGQNQINWEELPGVSVVPGTGPEITDQGRWSTYYRVVLRCVDGSLLEAQWAEGSTEMQDVEPEMELWEVEAKEEIVVRFARIK
jgi:hypothetical protein